MSMSISVSTPLPVSVPMSMSMLMPCPFHSPVCIRVQALVHVHIHVHVNALLILKDLFWDIDIVSPGIDPGYSHLPQTKIIMYKGFGVLLACEKCFKIYSSAPGQRDDPLQVVLTVRFPIT